jgi:AraC-like DNA-binding protein
MVGAYFRPARVAPFAGAAVSDLTDRTVDIDDLWGAAGSRLGDALCDLSEAERIDQLELALLARVRNGRRRTGSIRFEQVAATVLNRRGRVTVDAVARHAGVSRQYLTRQFREYFGIGPKLYSRLARFQSGLVCAGRPERIDWAQMAVELGYADQSHLIAEFRQFSGLTPQALAKHRWFHPFIERAKLRGTVSTANRSGAQTPVSISTSNRIARR